MRKGWLDFFAVREPFVLSMLYTVWYFPKVIVRVSARSRRFCQPFCPRLEPARGKSHRLWFMFRCQLCTRVVPPRTPACRLVVASRPKKYPFRPKANLVRYLEFKNGRAKRKEKETDDPRGVGHETVREMLVCPNCANDRVVT